VSTAVQPQYSSRKRPLHAITVAAFAALIVAIVVGYELSRKYFGIFRAGDYPDILRRLGGRARHFPRSIPHEASGVRIVAVGAYDILLRTPDHHAEVRFLLPLSMAEEVRRYSEAHAVVAGYEFGPRDLWTLDPGDRASPSPDYVTYPLVNFGGMNTGGVTINTTTGEVVYWLFES